MPGVTNLSSTGID